MKLPQKIRNLGTLVALASALSFSCGKSPTSSDNTTTENNRPQTYIDNHSITGPNQNNQYQLYIEGHGTDSDGYVRGFEYKLNNNSWSDIIFTTQGFSRSISGLNNGNHTFRLRAIDDKGEEDLSPASLNFSIEEENIEEVEYETTNQSGHVEFPDGKEVRIKDYDTANPISGIEIAYLPLEEYKIISIRNSNYISLRKLTTSSGLETIFIKNSNQHENDIRYLYGEERDLCRKYARDLMDDSLSERSSGCSIYQNTNSGINEAGASLAFEGILMYFGVDWVMEVAGEAIRLIDEDAVAPPTLTEILDNNWDHYEVDSPMWVGEKSYIRIESNKPSISLDQLNINNSNANLTFSGTDRTTYEIPVSGVINDKTTNCRGPTTSADKWYFWTFFFIIGRSS